MLAVAAAGGVAAIVGETTEAASKVSLDAAAESLYVLQVELERENVVAAI